MTDPKMEILRKLRTSLGDLAVQSDFSEPEFRLFSDWPGLQQRLFTRLSPYGLRLIDMRWDPGNGTVGDGNLMLNLPDLAATVRIRLERIEIQYFDPTRIDVQTAGKMVVDILKVMEGDKSAAKFKTHSLRMNIHGILEDSTPRDFLSRYVSQIPENFGPKVGNAVAFYYGPEANRLTTSITFDLSVRVKDGLYLGIQTVWDAQRISVEAFPAIAADHVTDVLTRCGLEFARPGQS